MPSFHSPSLAMYMHLEEDCPFLALSMDIHSSVQESWNAISHHSKERGRPVIMCDPLKFFHTNPRLFVQSDLSEVGQQEKGLIVFLAESSLTLVGRSDTKNRFNLLKET